MIYIPPQYEEGGRGIHFVSLPLPLPLLRLQHDFSISPPSLDHILMLIYCTPTHHNPTRLFSLLHPIIFPSTIETFLLQHNDNVKSGEMFSVFLLQIKYILFVGENNAGTDDIKMRQAIRNKIRVCRLGRNRFCTQTREKRAE